MCLACILLAAMKVKGLPDGKACVPPCVVSGLAPGPALPYTVTPTAAAATIFLRTRDFLFSKFLTYNVMSVESEVGVGMGVSKTQGLQLGLQTGEAQGL